MEISNLVVAMGPEPAFSDSTSDIPCSCLFVFKKCIKWDSNKLWVKQSPWVKWLFLTCSICLWSNLWGQSSTWQDMRRGSRKLPQTMKQEATASTWTERTRWSVRVWLGSLLTLRCSGLHSDLRTNNHHRNKIIPLSNQFPKTSETLNAAYSGPFMVVSFHQVISRKNIS